MYSLTIGGLGPGAVTDSPKADPGSGNTASAPASTGLLSPWPPDTDYTHCPPYNHSANPECGQ